MCFCIFLIFVEKKLLQNGKIRAIMNAERGFWMEFPKQKGKDEI